MAVPINGLLYLHTPWDTAGEIQESKGFVGIAMMKPSDIVAPFADPALAFNSHEEFANGIPLELYLHESRTPSPSQESVRWWPGME